MGRRRLSQAGPSLCVWRFKSDDGDRRSSTVEILLCARGDRRASSFPCCRIDAISSTAYDASCNLVGRLLCRLTLVGSPWRKRLSRQTITTISYERQMALPPPPVTPSESKSERNRGWGEGGKGAGAHTLHAAPRSFSSLLAGLLEDRCRPTLDARCWLASAPVGKRRESEQTLPRRKHDERDPLPPPLRAPETPKQSACRLQITLINASTSYPNLTGLASCAVGRRLVCLRGSICKAPPFLRRTDLVGPFQQANQGGSGECACRRDGGRWMWEASMRAPPLPGACLRARLLASSPNPGAPDIGLTSRFLLSRFVSIEQQMRPAAAMAVVVAAYV